MEIPNDPPTMKSVAEDMIEIGFSLPWWANLVLAGGAYLLFHHLSTAAVPEAGTVGELGKSVSAQLIRTFSGYAQYLLPALLGIGMLGSLAKRAKRKVLFEKLAVSLRRGRSKTCPGPNSNKSSSNFLKEWGSKFRIRGEARTVGLTSV